MKENFFHFIMTSCTECKSSKFGFNHSHPWRFVESEWPGHHAIYLTWRWLSAIYFTTTYILAWFDFTNDFSPYDWHWLLYLTQWAFVFLTAMLLVEAVVCSVAAGPCSSYSSVEGRNGQPPNETKDTRPRLAWWLKLLWWMNAVGTTFSFGTCLIFWAILIPLAGVPDEGFSFNSLNTHLIPAIYLLINAFVTATPVRVLHLVYPVTLCAVYLVFNMAYIVSGGKKETGDDYIYPVLDWNESPGWAVFYGLLVVLVVTPLVHCFFFGLYKLRVFVASKCCRSFLVQRQHEERNDFNTQV